MHELFTQVLSKKDLSKAGDLFLVADQAIVNDLTEVVNTISGITSLPDYLSNDNDQSVVEICITRVTSAIRETGTIEQHAEALVALLESCLNHNLKPSSKDEDPPHAKISSDIISCLFLNYSKKEVMKLALPVAVKFLHKGNKELSRNMSSYLSLAAIENADLLAKHIQPIIDSIISGNYTLARVLPQIYAVNKEPLHDHVMALVSLLPLCENPEKLALLSLFGLIAKTKPSLLEPSLPQLCEYLSVGATASATMQVFRDMAVTRPQLLVEHLQKIKNAADSHPNTLCLAAQVISSVGKLNKDRAQEALNFVLEHLPKADRGSQGTLLREATLLCSSYPVLFTEKMLAEVRQHGYRNETQSNSHSIVNQTSNGVTIVKVGGESRQDFTSSIHPHSLRGDMSTSSVILSERHTPSILFNRQDINRLVGSRPKLGDSRSTGKLTTAHVNRSMTRLNAGPGNGSRIGSCAGLHKSMTRLSSSQQINLVPVSVGVTINQNSGNVGSRHNLPSTTHISCGGVTVTTTPLTVSPTKSTSGSISALREERDLIASVSSSFHHFNGQNINPMMVQSGRELLLPLSSSASSPSNVTHLMQSGTRLHSPFHLSQTAMASTLSNSGTASPLNRSGTVVSSSSSPLSQSTSITSTTNHPCVAHTVTSQTLPTTVMTSSQTNPRRANTSITIISNNHQQSMGLGASQRISVFEPFPMRDTIQHFCEKHLDKIKLYMDKVCIRIPPPAKCTIEERKARKIAKLHFACQGRGEHCLYNRTFFTMKTRNPRVWIHLMFLALQARSQSALSSRETSVSSLKNCWDILKCENKTFLTLVTSAFPCAKDQDCILHELRNSGFFDVFEYNGPLKQWGCFLCNHPDKAVGFLQDTQPVIEGQLKEKKGRWKIFKRWRTRYFTLSGAHLSYKGTKSDKTATPIEVNQIRSVKVSRGARNIPKAFEIFTNDKSLILKPKDGKNAEEWVQCLSIAVAHSHARELPTKSNSLPARGASLRTAV